MKHLSKTPANFGWIAVEAEVCILYTVSKYLIKYEKNTLEKSTSSLGLKMSPSPLEQKAWSTLNESGQIKLSVHNNLSFYRKKL